MTSDLKKHLEANPQLSHVYLNDNYEWQFHKRAGYETVLTRDEVLDMKVADETEEASKPAKVKKAKVADETEENKETE